MRLEKVQQELPLLVGTGSLYQAALVLWEQGKNKLKAVPAPTHPGWDEQKQW